VRMRRILLGVAPFLAALGVLAAMTLRALRRDPYVVDPRRQGYGQNWPGDLSSEIGMGVWELLALMLVLRPWSYRHSWGRALVALVLFFGWTMVTAILGMHAGSINGAHLVWRAGVVLVLLVLAAISGYEAVRARRSAGSMDVTCEATTRTTPDGSSRPMKRRGGSSLRVHRQGD